MYDMISHIALIVHSVILLILVIGLYRIISRVQALMVLDDETVKQMLSDFWCSTKIEQFIRERKGK